MEVWRNVVMMQHWQSDCNKSLAWFKPLFYSQQELKCLICRKKSTSKSERYEICDFMFRLLSNLSDLAPQFLPPANVVCEGYVFTGVCLSTGGGGCYPIMHCRWYPSIPCSRSGRGIIPACLAGFQAHTQGGGGKFRGIWPGVLCSGGGGCGDPSVMATAGGGTHPTGLHSC